MTMLKNLIAMGNIERDFVFEGISMLRERYLFSSANLFRN